VQPRNTLQAFQKAKTKPEHSRQNNHPNKPKQNLKKTNNRKTRNQKKQHCRNQLTRISAGKFHKEQKSYYLLIEQDVEPKWSRCELEKQQHIYNTDTVKRIRQTKNPTSLNHMSIMRTKGSTSS
jgi:hypothetical protein